jgi:hypothetical protein
VEDSCGGVVAREDLVGPVELLQFGLLALSDLCRHLIFLALRRIEVLGRVILSRVVESLRGRCNVRHRFPTARNFNLLSVICN